MSESVKKLKEDIMMLECDKDELQLDLTIAYKKLQAIKLIDELLTERELDFVIKYLTDKKTAYASGSTAKTHAHNLIKMIENLESNCYENAEILSYLHICCYDIAFDSKDPEAALNGVIMTDKMKAIKLEKMEKKGGIK